MKNKLYILCGIPFSGKTFLAKKIKEKLGYTIVDLDEVKFEFYGKNIKDSDVNQKGWERIYQEMYKRIETKLKNGETVIHDTGNFTKYERNLVKKIADNLGIEAITVFVDIPVEDARKRLLQNRKTNKRFDVTDKDFASTIAEMERPDEREKHIIYRYGTPIDSWIRDKLSY